MRDIYAVDAEHMLIVTTDRLSAFDVVLPDPIPGKGAILTRISKFWFDTTQHIVANHLTEYPLARAVPDPIERAPIADRSMIVKRLHALPIEAVVRGYLIGSGWKDYQQTGSVCGIALPAGLRQADRLPDPLFTPATKAELGVHDENIRYERVVSLIGRGLAEQVRAAALALYSFAAEYAPHAGIIIADTKFEFGVDEAGRLTLIDEALTPDSSRFWPVDTLSAGVSVRRASTNSSCATTSKRSTGTSAHRDRSCLGNHRKHQRQVCRSVATPDRLTAMRARELLEFGPRQHRDGFISSERMTERD